MCYCQTVQLGGACPVCGNSYQTIKATEPLGLHTFCNYDEGHVSPHTCSTKRDPSEWILSYRAAVDVKNLNSAAAVLFRKAGMTDALEWISLLDEVSTKRKYLLESEIKMRRELCIKAMGVIGFNPGKEDGPANPVVPTTFEQFNAKASA